MTPEEIEALRQQQQSETMNTDHPMPDPAWDYLAIWQDAWHLREEASRLLAAVSDAETSSPQTDTQIREQIATIVAHCKDILRALDGVEGQNGDDGS